MKKENGFTIIEVILVVTITGIVSSIIYGSFITSNSVLEFNKEKVNIQQDHRVIVNKIAPYIRMARTVTITSTYNNSGDKLRLSFTKIEADKDYIGIGFGIKDGGKFYYRKHREIKKRDKDSSSIFEWGNRMTFITSKVNKFEISENDNMIAITIELEEADGDIYTFVDEFYRRIP